MKLRPSHRETIIRKVIAGALVKLAPEELVQANEAITKRSVPKPGSIKELIAQFSDPKRSTLVFFDPHPEMVQAALEFKNVHIVEGNDTMKKLLRVVLFRLGLSEVTCSSKYPERGEFNTIYVGGPFNKEAVRLLYVPSGALLIFQNIPYNENTPQDELTLEQKLSRNTFNSLVNAGYACIYPPSTGSLSSSDFYILKKP